MKIGLGIVTYNREDYFKQVIKSIDKEYIDEIVVCNDGTPYKSDIYPDYIEVLQNSENKGVAITKNNCMRHLLDKKCDYIFLIEDDILVKDNNVFNEYIKLHEETGIHHFNFALHGPANKKNGIKSPRLVVDYGNEVKVSLYQHCVGAFCFYTRQCLEKVGLLDETYINNTEHVDHDYMLDKNCMSTPFWWFPDLVSSDNYLDEIACSEVSSVIRFTDNWRPNIQKGWQYFNKKHGHHLLHTPNVTEDKVMNRLRELKRNINE